MKQTLSSKMWEFVIEDSLDKISSIEKMVSQLKREVAFFGGLVVSDVCGDRVKLCVAVPERASEYFSALVSSLIAESIVLNEKYSFLKSNIRFPINDSVLVDAFLTALSVFDKQTDIDYIKDKLVIAKEIILDSFFEFRLSELKIRWGDIARLIQDNMPSLLISDGFLDMIHFLINTTPIENGEIHVIFYESIPYFCNAKLEKQANVPKKFNICSSVVSGLIELCPAKIVLHSETDNELSNILRSVFKEKAHIVPIEKKL